MSARNVLPVRPLNAAPRQKDYREAVARVIRDLKAERGLTNVTLSEEIGCCADTIGNAENQNNDLSAVLLLKIAFVFGEKAIEPVRELYLRRVDARQSILDRMRALLADMESGDQR